MGQQLNYQYVIVINIFKNVYLFIGNPYFNFQNDRIYRAMIASQWHLLPISEQKMWTLMIFKAQNPVILKAGVMPLNLDTFVNVFY